MTEIGEDESCVDIAVESKKGLLRSNELKCKAEEVVEDDNWEDTVLERERDFVLLNKLEEFITEIGAEASCVGNKIECKPSLLVLNKARGKVGRAVLEGNWEATVRKGVMGL